MNNNKVLWTKNGSSEFYTPPYAIAPIIKYIDPNWTVWCPFDLIDSNYVKQILRANNKVVHSHIINGQNFFNYQPKKFDCIISNPPFQNKKEFFKRILSFNKPFAILMTLTWLNDRTVFKLYDKKQMQLVLFDKRIKFENEHGIINKNITFACGYYCWNFLPNNLITEKL